MRITKEGLSNRLNFLLFISDVSNEENSNTVFGVDVYHREGDYLEYVIGFTSPNRPGETQYFYGDSDEYDSYEDLINDIGYVFHKTHFDDSLIDFLTFESYMDSYYKINTTLSFVARTESKEASAELLHEFAANATKKELSEAVMCSGIKDADDIPSALDALAKTVPNHIVKTVANVIHKYYSVLEITPGNVLTSVHSDRNFKVSELIYVERNNLSKGVALIKNIMAAMPFDLQLEILDAVCIRLPKVAVEALAEEFELTDSEIAMSVSEKTVEGKLIEKFGTDWEEKYYDLIHPAKVMDEDIEEGTAKGLLS